MIFGTNVLGPMPSTGPVRIWDAGVVWADIEKQRNVYDWSRLDAIVDSAGKRSIMIVLGHPPAWAAKGGADGKQAAWMPAGSNRPPANLMLWRRYVTDVVMRYKDSVNLFQVWNEPADKRFYSGSYDELATLCKIANQIIKRIHPKAFVCSPPLQPRRQAGWKTRGSAIVKTLKDAGYPFDIWAAHIYPQKGEGIEGFIRDCELVKKVTDPTKKPLWITECNYNLVGEGNPYPPFIQAQLKIDTRKACTNLNINRLYWYGPLHNEPHLFAITIP